MGINQGLSKEIKACRKPFALSVPNRCVPQSPTGHGGPGKFARQSEFTCPRPAPDGWRTLAPAANRIDSNQRPGALYRQRAFGHVAYEIRRRSKKRISEIAASRIIDRSTSFRSSAPPSPWLRWARPIFRSTQASTCLGVPGPTDGGCVCALVTIWLVNHQSNAVAYPPLPSKFRPQHRHKSNRRRCCGTQATPTTRGHLDRVRFGWGRSSDRSLQNSLDGPARAQTGQGASVAKRRR